jgi:hypothetical protein
MYQTLRRMPGPSCSELRTKVMTSDVPPLYTLCTLPSRSVLDHDGRLWPRRAVARASSSFSGIIMCKRRPARTLFILGCLVFYLVLWTMEVKLILVADHHQRHGDDAKKKMTTKHVVPSSFGSSPREESSSLLHHDFPPPRIFSKNSNAVVVIIVLSARGNSERRQAIRETWASSSERTSSDDVPPVCFVLGAPASCNSQHSRLCQEEELLINATENGLILREQARHGDLLMISTPESYRSLPYKVSGAYTWISNNCARAEWIVKVDDDMYVKTDSIAHYLQQLSRHSRGNTKDRSSA